MVTEIETLSVDAETRAVTVELPTNSNTDAVSFVATSASSAELQVAANLPLDVTRMANGSRVLISDPATGGNNVLTYNGDATANSFTITRGGASTIGIIDSDLSVATVETSDIEGLSLNAGAGQDTVTIGANPPYSLTLDGGADDDTVVITGNGTAITIDVSGAHPVIWGGGIALPTAKLTLTDFESIDLSAANSAVSIVTGTKAAAYTPVTANSGTIEMTGGTDGFTQWRQRVEHCQ